MKQRCPITREELIKLQEEISDLARGFDYVADHVVITDENANIIYANKGVESHTGFKISEVIGKNPGDLWGGIMNEEVYSRMWKVIKKERAPFYAEVQNRKKDGNLYWQELRIFPILNESGNAKFFIGIEPDITIQKIFAGHTQQYIEEMEKLNKYFENREVKIKDLEKEVARLRNKLQEVTL